MNSTAALRLEGADDAFFPFWSPDGREIGFFTEDKIKRVAISGGGPQVVCSLSGPGGSQMNGAAWSADGTIVFGEYGKPLSRVSASGATPTAATSLGKDERAQIWPQFLPDGKHVLYLAQTASGNATYVEELGTGKRVRVLENPTRTMWSPPGYLLYTQDGNLYARRMNSGTYQLEGQPVLVAQDVVLSTANGRSTFSVSRNGLLVYREGADLPNRTLNWRDRAGKALRSIGKPALSVDMSLAPDEKSAAIVLAKSGSYDVWLTDLATGTTTPLTRDSKMPNSILGAVAWSPDSRKVAIPVMPQGIRVIEVDRDKPA
jgi:hypothetical protein